MATVTIPIDGSGGNPVRVMINGVEYVIPRGVETTVSDAVAAELAKPDMALIGGSGYPEDPRILPLVDATDNGKVLTVVEDAWAAAAPSGGAAVAPATISGDTLTINEKAGSLMAKCESGPVVAVVSADGQTAFCAPIVYAAHSGSTYTFTMVSPSGSLSVVAASADDYPTATGG